MKIWCQMIYVCYNTWNMVDYSGFSWHTEVDSRCSFPEKLHHFEEPVTLYLTGWQQHVWDEWVGYLWQDSMQPNVRIQHKNILHSEEATYLQVCQVSHMCTNCLPRMLQISAGPAVLCTPACAPLHLKCAVTFVLCSPMMCHQTVSWWYRLALIFCQGVPHR